MADETTYTAFAGETLISSGPLQTLIPVIHRHSGPVLIFENHTGRQIDFDLRGTAQEALARAVPPPRVGPGRPKLGVVSREVSLLPRHWEWLEEQPNGASAAIRRLVDEARKTDPEGQRTRRATEATGRFLSAIAGNLPNYEEATRALYNGDQPRFQGLISAWPPDIQTHALHLLGHQLG